MFSHARLLPCLGLLLFLAGGRPAGAEPLPATEGEIRKRVVGVLGARFNPGGRDRRHGFDAKGLIAYLFADREVTLPAKASDLAGFGRAVAVETAEPWDLLVAPGGGDGDEPTLGVFLGAREVVTVSGESRRVVVARLEDPPWNETGTAARRLLAAPEPVGRAARSPAPLKPGAWSLTPALRSLTPAPATLAWQDRPALDSVPDGPEEPEPKAGPPARRKVEVGLASFYGGSRDRRAGKWTSSGERFNTRAYTAAHRTHPFGSLVRVTNLENGSTVVVRVNDRGPHVRGRVIDLSRAAAGKLGFLSKGLVRVKVELLRKETRRPA